LTEGCSTSELVGQRGLPVSCIDLLFPHGNEGAIREAQHGKKSKRRREESHTGGWLHGRKKGNAPRQQASYTNLFRRAPATRAVNELMRKEVSENGGQEQKSSDEFKVMQPSHGDPNIRNENGGPHHSDLPSMALVETMPLRPHLVRRQAPPFEPAIGGVGQPD
jgi:hypothetical protein